MSKSGIATNFLKAGNSLAAIFPLQGIDSVASNAESVQIKNNTAHIFVQLQGSASSSVSAENAKIRDKSSSFSFELTTPPEQFTLVLAPAFQLPELVNVPFESVNTPVQEESKGRLLLRQYEMRNKAEVLRFLTKHPYLVELLLEAHNKIAEYFPDSLANLAVSFDREEDGGEELVASIVTKLKPKEALKRLDQFDEEWWLDASDVSEGELCIRLEYE